MSKTLEQVARELLEAVDGIMYGTSPHKDWSSLTAAKNSLRSALSAETPPTTRSATMDAEQIQAWAREVGAHTTYSGGLCLYAGQFEALARLVRAAAFEEAAAWCRKFSGSALRAEECAAGLEALAAAEKEPR